MLFVLVGELGTFTPSMGFNVTTLGQKVTGYKGTVGLDVTMNKAAGAKSHIIAIEKNEQDVVGLFCQIKGQRPCCFVLYNHLYILLFCYLHATLESLGSLQMTSPNGCMNRYFASG